MWCQLCDIYQSWKTLESDDQSVCSVQLWWEINMKILKLECFLSDSFEQVLFDCFYKAVFFPEENHFTLIIRKEKKSIQKIPQSPKTLNQETQFPTPLESKLFRPHIFIKTIMFCMVVFNQELKNNKGKNCLPYSWTVLNFSGAEAVMWWMKSI